jgi:hypothetical protein
MKPSRDNQTARLLDASELESVSGGDIGEWFFGNGGTESHENASTSVTISSVRGGEVSGSTSVHEGRFM